MLENKHIYLGEHALLLILKCIVILLVAVAIGFVARTFILKNNNPAEIAAEVIGQPEKTSPLLDRIEVLEALYIALNEKVNGYKDRPQINIHKAYVTNERGSITIEEIKEHLTKEWEDVLQGE